MPKQDSGKESAMRVLRMVRRVLLGMGFYKALEHLGIALTKVHGV